MRKMDRKELFEDFSRTAQLLAEHQDEVRLLRFEARLGNGTRFNLDYDAERGRSKGPHHALSVPGAVLDIIAGLAALVMLIFTSACPGPMSGPVHASYILAFTAYLLLFPTSATYHLFDEGHIRTTMVLRMVRQGLLAASVMLSCFAICMAQGQSAIWLPVLLLCAGLSLLLSWLGTKNAWKVSCLLLALSHLIPAIGAAGPGRNMLFTVIGFICTALPGFMPETVQEGRTRPRTLAILPLAAMTAFALTLPSL